MAAVSKSAKGWMYACIALAVGVGGYFLYKWYEKRQNTAGSGEGE